MEYETADMKYVRGEEVVYYDHSQNEYFAIDLTNRRTMMIPDTHISEFDPELEAEIRLALDPAPEPEPVNRYTFLDIR